MSMYMDYAHPEFDIVMELVASLCRAPDLTPISLLQSDFHCNTQDEVRKLLGKVETRGYKIITGNIGRSGPHSVVRQGARRRGNPRQAGQAGGKAHQGSGRGAALAIETAGAARTVAENYLRRVYDGRMGVTV